MRKRGRIYFYPCSFIWYIYHRTKVSMLDFYNLYIHVKEENMVFLLLLLLTISQAIHAMREKSLTFPDAAENVVVDKSSKDVTIIIKVKSKTFVLPSNKSFSTPAKRRYLCIKDFDALSFENNQKEGEKETKLYQSLTERVDQYNLIKKNKEGSASITKEYKAIKPVFLDHHAKLLMIAFNKGEVPIVKQLTRIPEIFNVSLSWQELKNGTTFQEHTGTIKDYMELYQSSDIQGHQECLKLA